MADPKEELPQLLSFIPWWRKGDPVPDWNWIKVIQEVSRETRIQLVISQLQYENDVAQAASNAIERNIKILTAGRK
jgi:hypothetical protein